MGSFTARGARQPTIIHAAAVATGKANRRNATTAHPPLLPDALVRGAQDAQMYSDPPV
ncbi:hypothetical protein AB0I28_21570 [Phytomonospora sp. NPDC050363]|uniref:hypothetical protein n=1 Tax=Phytomonospora sp. NPDC050363 TaxID=3155642 RepID=UPI0033FEFE3E